MCIELLSEQMTINIRNIKLLQASCIREIIRLQ